MSGMRFKKRTLLIAIIILLMIFIIIYPAIFTWSPMCCRYEDVDINTGRIRYTRYLLYCKISEKVKNSTLTEPIGVFDEDTQPNWKNVNDFSPTVMFPQKMYRYLNILRTKIYSVSNCRFSFFQYRLNNGGNFPPAYRFWYKFSDSNAFDFLGTDVFRKS
jgi:hypothetical protein